jgi:hypothetical protein
MGCRIEPGCPEITGRLARKTGDYVESLDNKYSRDRCIEHNRLEQCRSSFALFHQNMG